MPASARSVLVIGDPLLDLVCERPVGRLTDAAGFVPHQGGAAVNVAVVAARAGAAVRLAGGVGGDDWGGWLRARLEREGIDTGLLRTFPDRPTPLALVHVSAAGEPAYTLYGPAASALPGLPREGLHEALSGSGGLFLNSVLLVGEEERAAAMELRTAALEQDRAVVFDPSLRLHRWRSAADAAASANACVPDATLVRANAAEATLMTGEPDPERAAAALLKAGARAVIISLGSAGAIMRGPHRLDVPAETVKVLSTSGAGDTLTGLVLAQLALSGFYLPAVAAGLREAVAGATRVCRQWGALD